ncbi:MAG: HutD family protein, partial [Mesorhizobium sp.]
RVETSGPFSSFAGIDRTLSVLEGEGIVLDIAGRAPALLTADSAPLAFAGDVPTSAALISGPITDLNVMTRRGRMA